MSDALEDRMELFQRCLEARDGETLSEVLDEDYALVLVQPARAIVPRERWLEVLPDYVIHDYEVEERFIHADDGCAAVLQRVRMNATVAGNDRSGVFILSDVWRMRDGTWRLWRRHSTPLSAGELSA